MLTFFGNTGAPAYSGIPASYRSSRALTSSPAPPNCLSKVFLKSGEFSMPNASTSNNAMSLTHASTLSYILSYCCFRHLSCQSCCQNPEFTSYRPFAFVGCTSLMASQMTSQWSCQSCPWPRSRKVGREFSQNMFPNVVPYFFLHHRPIFLMNASVFSVSPSHL